VSRKQLFQRDALALRLTLVVWAFGYALVALTMAARGEAPLPLTLLSQVPLFVVGVAMTMLVRRAHRWSERDPGPLRWSLLAAAMTAGAICQTGVDLSYHWLLGQTVAPAWKPWTSGFSSERIFIVSLIYVWTLGLNVTLFWAGNVNEHARRQAERAAAAEAATHRAEAAALRLQLNPHFLFNSLNAIASLTVTRRNEEATLMIGELADFLRSSLASDPGELAPLCDEVATVAAYLRIERVRFPDRLDLAVDIADGASNLLVPNFLLQPLVENAVKHGVAPTRRRVSIEVTARREDDGLLAVTVSNRMADGRPINERRTGEPAPVGAGIGLRNVRQRLGVLYGARASLTTTSLPDGYAATVRLPALAGEAA